ncbi:MAG: RNA polymerase sigma factor [Bacteroidota bacterium]
MKNHQALTDQRIIQRCKEGNETGYAQLYRSTAPYVYSFLKRYVNDADYRKDLMQEIYAKVFLHIAQYDPTKGSFKNWLRKITVNECLQYLRRSKKLPYTEDLEENPYLRDDAPLPTDLKREDVEQLLHRMPNGYRLIFMLSVMDGFSHREIAQSLDITSETSRSQLARAKRWIRQHFSKHPKKDLYGLL